jgi:uncharacterized protein HemX
MTNPDPKEESNNDPRQSLDTPANARRGSSGGLAGGLALILSVVSLLASAYLGYTFIEKRGIYRSDIFSRLDKLEDASAMQQKNLELLAQQNADMKATQETLKVGMEKLSGILDKGRSDWLRAETEQLMLIANHRLQLAHDAHLALESLRAADRQLHQLGDPRYLPVRKVLAEEISQMESLERLDIPGMSLRLGELAARLDQLPLATDTDRAKAVHAATPPPTDNRSVAQDMWNDIGKLIRIRRGDEMRKPLLPPDQQYFLRENLRLMLYSAQNALLQGDTATYERNIKTASQWLKDFFDHDAQVVRAAQTDLDQMLQTHLSTRLPDISRSLRMMRDIGGRKSES